MTLLTAPWFWVGLAIVASAVALAWFAAHPKPPPIVSSGVGGRPETHHDHAEFVDDLR